MELRDLEWPVLTRYEGEHLARIAFPLGGIGTGTVSLGGRGDLRDWEIMNRPSKGFRPRDTFFAIWVKPEGGQALTRVLEGQIPPPYDGQFGVEEPVAGLPRFRKAVFEAAYPLARIRLTDPSVPIEVVMKAFNPLIPLDPDRSGLPIVLFRFVLSNPSHLPVEASICFSIDNFIGYDGVEGEAKGNLIEYREEGEVKGMFLHSEGVPESSPQWGTIAFAALDGEVSYRDWLGERAWRTDLLDFWDDFSEDGELNWHREPGSAHASLAARRIIPPHGRETLNFLLAWHFPNRTARACGWGTWPGEKEGYVGNYYARRFRDAWDVIVKTVEELPELERRTVEFVRLICSSTLPQPVKEAALNNLSALRTQTCFRTADGRFFGFEGCRDKSGCCFGSCTHVWNYEQATAFLFPQLARSMREVEFKFSTTEEGAMAFRTPLPLKKAEGRVRTAADGQMGCIMKLYREWRFSGDDGFLKEMWPAAKKALSFAWRPGSWDADEDGVMEGEQHNTYDVEFYGPNPMMECWYLGALRAAEVMAAYLGDEGFAAKCRELFERGSRWTDENLFNGEYYEQRIDPNHPDYQFGSGCLIDQLVGQYMAHVVGLGYLLKPGNVRTALRSIYRYNFKGSLHNHWNVMRTFALNDESAVLICTWPRGGRPKRPFPYFSEAMTGFEYQFAVHLIYEGMVEEGLKVIEAIRRRYDGRRRNPWDEAECGHHYARAMASWGAILALSGYRYDGVLKEMRFAPKVSADDFRVFWSSPRGWGWYEQRVFGGKLEAGISVSFGEVGIKRLGLPRAVEPGEVKAWARGEEVKLDVEVSGEGIVLTFDQPLELKEGTSLRVSIAPR